MSLLNKKNEIAYMFYVMCFEYISLIVDISTKVVEEQALVLDLTENSTFNLMLSRKKIRNKKKKVRYKRLILTIYI